MSLAKVNALLHQIPLSVTLVFLALGLLVVGNFVFTFLYGIWARLLRPGKNLKKSFGLWGNFLIIIFEILLLLIFPSPPLISF